MKKGIILPTVDTIIIVVFLMFAIVIAAAFMAYAFFNRGFIGEAKSQEEFSFISLKSQAFGLGVSLSHMQNDRRNIYEQLIEAGTTGMNNSGTRQLPQFLMAVGKSLGYSYYNFELRKNEGILLTANNLEYQCGANNEGFCIYDKGYVDVCDTGRVVIDGQCPAYKICCKYDPLQYVTKGGKDDIVACGNNKGICAGFGVKFSEGQGGNNPEKVAGCPYGMTLVSTDVNECEDSNIDQNIGPDRSRTPVCCSELTSETLQERYVISSAFVPLLYRGPALFQPKEYNCQLESQPCSGEYVAGLCESRFGENAKCCVTDVIRCRPPNTNYICRDASQTGPLHCPVGKLVDSGECPGPQNYQCCKLENPPATNLGASQPSESLGPCKIEGKIEGESYYEPVFAELEVSLSEG